MSEKQHLVYSLLGCVLFMTMGLMLEGLAAFRWQPWFDDTIRREFLRLGHAHGAVLSILSLAIANLLERGNFDTKWRSAIRLASCIGTGLVGGGFVAGGLWHGPTDPGLGILAVPGGALLWVSALIALILLRTQEKSN